MHAPTRFQHLGRWDWRVCDADSEVGLQILDHSAPSTTHYDQRDHDSSWITVRRLIAALAVAVIGLLAVSALQLGVERAAWLLIAAQLG